MLRLTRSRVLPRTNEPTQRRYRGEDIARTINFGTKSARGFKMQTSTDVIMR